MARQRLAVTYTDGRVAEARITPKVEVAVERHFEVGLATLQKDAHAEHMYYMAWMALRYSGQEPKSFEDFLNEIDDVDLVESEKSADADDPMKEGQPSGPSLS